MVFHSQIPKELKEGEIYTSREICYFITFNDVNIISEETSQFTKVDNVKYKISSVFEVYIHRNKERDCYLIPMSKRKVYLVKKCEDI